MNGAAQRMLESRTRRGLPGVFPGVLIGLAVSTLPMCDACHDAELANAVAAAGLGGDSGSSALGACALWIAIAIAIVLAMAKAFAVAGRGLPIAILGVAIAAWMVWSSSAEIARTRSSAVDEWPICYDDGRSTSGPYGRPPLFEGPHLPNGDPCVLESEDRIAHHREHPEGDVPDGIHQIRYRFAEDRPRVLYLPAALLSGLVIALVLAIVDARRRKKPSLTI